MAKLKGFDKTLFVITSIALLVIICVAGRYISVFSPNVLVDQEKWGQFGDYFGGVLNPIFSFFAFVAVLYTLRTQIEDNKEGERRHDEQLREQRLFQLIGLMNQNAINTKCATSNPSEYVFGHQAQHHVLIKLMNTLSRIARQEISPVPSDLERFETLAYAYKTWRKTYWASVGSYVDSVFLVLGFILEERSSVNFKNFALKALRVQLSESERLLLWYSAMFNAEYVIYLDPLLQSGFLDDHAGSLDDQIKPMREKMIPCSRLWSHKELEKRQTNHK